MSGTKVRLVKSTHPLDNDKATRKESDPPASNGEARVFIQFGGYITLKRDTYLGLDVNASAADIVHAEYELLQECPESVLDIIPMLEKPEITIRLTMYGEGEEE